MDDDATKEALSHATKVLEYVADIFHKLAGPLAEEIGLTLGDRAREYRLKNALRIFERVKKLLADAGIDPRPIPPRLFLPMVEAASLEDDESLQDKWAALLANSCDPSQSVQPVFVNLIWPILII